MTITTMVQFLHSQPCMPCSQQCRWPEIRTHVSITDVSLRILGGTAVGRFTFSLEAKITFSLKNNDLTN